MGRLMVVLGTSHALQNAENYKRRIDDTSYSVLLTKLISEFSLDFIFEEASGCGPTTAKRLADSRGLKYLDVDPHPNDRERHGLERDTGADYNIYQPYDINAPKPIDIAVEEYLEAQVGREEFWVKSINEQSFNSALTICGFLHTLSFAVGLKSAGIEVFKVLAYMPYHKLT